MTERNYWGSREFLDNEAFKAKAKSHKAAFCNNLSYPVSIDESCVQSCLNGCPISFDRSVHVSNPVSMDRCTCPIL